MPKLSPPAVVEPFPISVVSGRYLIYDIDIVTYIRREYHICGVLIGSIPQIPQQNVFLGVPMELMPEEARRLAEVGAAFVLDDIAQHEGGLQNLGYKEGRAFAEILEMEGQKAAKAAQRRAEERRGKALHTLKDKGMEEEIQRKGSLATSRDRDESNSLDTGEQREQDLFSSDPLRPDSLTASRVHSSVKSAKSAVYAVTPTISYPPLPAPVESARHLPLPAPPASYPLYAHLHSKGYYLSPGLRFGCQYLVYPGDPLRFHSHFLAVGAEWDEEFDLLTLVGGGRLGTGVKKGYLIGGMAHENEAKQCQGEEGRPASVRTFCFEWGSM
ncbi:MAG: tRNA-splicing endonuclease subunit [Pycnora praestabilis]|nr:MAG: tRNA-splicing endonuclease subunit [Pycnora praestabilis]